MKPTTFTDSIAYAIRDNVPLIGMALALVLGIYGIGFIGSTVIASAKSSFMAPAAIAANP